MLFLRRRHNLQNHLRLHFGLHLRAYGWLLFGFICGIVPTVLWAQQTVPYPNPNYPYPPNLFNNPTPLNPTPLNPTPLNPAPFGNEDTTGKSDQSRRLAQDLLLQNENLQQQLRQILGANEKLQFQLEQLQEQTKSQTTEIQLLTIERDELKKQLTTLKKQTPTKSTQNLTGKNETNDYAKALKTYNNKQYKQAYQQWADFIRYYPTSSYLESASLKKSYSAYYLGNYKTAAAELAKFYENFPKSQQRVRAYLTLGVALKKINEKKLACQVFTDLTVRYKNHPDANIARARMAEYKC